MRHKNQSNEFIKECICVSYVNLLYEKPKEEITITDICNKSGFGRTTYYRHFSSDKNELIVHIGMKKWEEYKKNHIDEVNKDEGLELLNHVYNYKKFMLMLKKQNLIVQLYEILFNTYGIRETDNPILRYGKDILVGGYFGVIYDWILLGCIDTPQEIKAKIEEAFKLAIAAQNKKE